jgi:methyl-accepting chemotaxis protein
MGLVVVKRLIRAFVRPSSKPAFLRRFRITQRLVLCFGVTASLLVALGVFCLLQMQSIRAQGEAVESGALPSIAMADAIAIDLIKLRGESARLIANADDPGAVVTSKINVEQLKNEVEKRLQRLPRALRRQHRARLHQSLAGRLHRVHAGAA